MSWNVQRLMETATGYWPAGALGAAVELGVFEAIEASQGKCTAAGLAASKQWSTPHTEQLLDALAGMGVLVKAGDKYTLVPELAPLLSRSSPRCMLDALRFNADLFRVWAGLAESVRSGKPAIPPQAHLGVDPARTRRFVLGMQSRAATLAPPVAAAIDLTGKKRLLDLACGPGSYARLLAQRFPELRVTLSDLPHVLAITQELVASDPASARFTYTPADYHTDALPTAEGGFDAALYCGALHQETLDAGRALFKKIHATMAPGGEFWVVDFMLNADAATPVFSAMFSITMMLTNPTGRVWREDDAKCALSEAGFVDITSVRPQHSPYWILRARRNA